MINSIPASEYCNRIFDGTHETPKPSERGRPLVTSKNIVGGTLDKATAYNISEEDYEGIQRRSYVSQWDILFSMIGSVGEVYIEKSPEIDYAVKNVGVFSCLDESRAMWLYYYLKSATAQKIIRNHLNGAVQKFLSLGALRSFPVPSFDSSNEAAIHLLSALDSKIAVNHRINGELEGMAKLLYDYWFVQYDFPLSVAQAAALGKPRLAGKHYRRSGGPMVYHEQLKREIPKGWEVVTLSQIAQTGSGGTPASKNREYYDGGDITWINSGELNSPYILSGSNFITQAGLDNSSAKLFPFRTLLIALYGATAGKVSLLLTEACLNQAVCGIVPHDPKFLFYLKVLLSDLYSHLVMMSTGSARDNLSQDLVRNIKVVVPPPEILKQFDEFVGAGVATIANNIQQNQELTTLRDWLLPMLMNGQVRVTG